MTGQAVDLFGAYQRTGRLDLLNAAIELFRDAVTGTPSDHPDRPAYLYILGGALRVRFERTGQLADLDEAITVGRDAVAATPPGHPDRPLYLSDLSATLRARFERAGQQADLDEAITTARTLSLIHISEPTRPY